MTITEQNEIVVQTKAFLERYGLKKKYVAKVCGISGVDFSKFINGKLALS